MSIPDYQSIMLPLLQLTGDGKMHKLHDAIESLAQHFRLSDQEKTELLPSGKQPIFDNRLGWARTYMKKAGLLSAPQRGVFCITERGQVLLSGKPDRIDIGLLNQYQEFIEFRLLRRGKLDGQAPKPSPSISDTPEETLEFAFQGLRDDLGSEILAMIKACSPEFFENLVIDLLVSMGYGGSRTEAGRAIGQSGDGGIDGIIKEDRLGLDIIYLQAKRWDAVVGRPEIQKFAGALQGQRAKKGVFLTTSGFSRQAIEYVSLINSKIILIDGPQVTDLMIDHNVGVTVEKVYEVKRIDSDYFSDESFG
ncbi:MAG: restriction endonuclease [Thermosynechococcaceae cyanobacterium]